MSNYKKEWDQWLMNTERAAELCSSRMAGHSPPKKSNRKSNYTDIARKWFTEMPAQAYRLEHFRKPGSLYQLELSKLRRQFTHRYTNTSTGKQEYWFDWLCQNYPIWSVVNKGNGLQQENTQAMIHPDRDLVIQTQTPEQVLESVLAEHQNQTPEYISIDLENLQKFCTQTEYNLQTQTHRSPEYLASMRRNLTRARLLVKLAQATDRCEVSELTGKTRWLIPQFATWSPFGRKYYTGNTALQSAPAAVREAALGKCFSVDADASVFRFYRALSERYNIDSTILDLMLSDKQAFRNTLAQCIQNISGSQTFRVQLIKTALTALGFGARNTEYYNPETGEGSALQDIIRNSADRNRVTSHPDWVALSTFIERLKAAVRADTELLKSYRDEAAYWTDKRYTVDRVLSIMYQQAETAFMRDLISLLDMAGRHPVLWVHDGVYTLLDPRKASRDEDGIVHDITSTTDYLQREHNPYLKFTVSEHSEYLVTASVESAAELQQHRDLLREQQRIAQQLYTVPDQLTPGQRLSEIRSRNEHYETPEVQHNPEVQEYYSWDSQGNFQLRH